MDPFLPLPPGQSPRMPSGIAGLDTVLRGGFLQGGVCILMGRPGAGKTLLANQVSFHHVRSGGKVAYVTLLAESHGRMLEHLRPLAFFDPSYIPDQLCYMSAFRTLEEGGLPGLMELLRREVRRHGASLLVLDGLVQARRPRGCTATSRSSSTSCSSSPTSARPPCCCSPARARRSPSTPSTPWWTACSR